MNVKTECQGVLLSSLSLLAASIQTPGWERWRTSLGLRWLLLAQPGACYCTPTPCMQQPISNYVNMPGCLLSKGTAILSAICMYFKLTCSRQRSRFMNLITFSFPECQQWKRRQRPSSLDPPLAKGMPKAVVCPKSCSCEGYEPAETLGFQSQVQRSFQGFPYAILSTSGTHLSRVWFSVLDHQVP